MTAAHLVFAIATSAYSLIAIQFEERDLLRFHAEYADYRRRVPMLVPFGSPRREKTTDAPEAPRRKCERGPERWRPQMICKLAQNVDRKADIAEGVGLRRATLEDITTIAEHRRSMFRDIGHHDTAALNRMMKNFLPWVQAKISSGDYLAWLAATRADVVVAGAGLWLMERPAQMVGSSARRGNILNVYTEPEFRRRGLARWLVEAALHWCTTNEIDLVILHASQQGRRLYQSLGFEISNEMRVEIKGGQYPEPYVHEQGSRV